VSSIEPDNGCSEKNGGQKVAIGFVIAGSDGAELLEFAEKILDQVACLIEVSIMLAWDFAVPLRWNHDGFTRLLQRFNHPLIGIIALVRDDDLGFQSGQEFVRSR